MNVPHRWARSAAALIAAAAVVPFAAAPAGAATAEYTRATYLQHALGLSPADTTPVIESVTYDRFQWLLQQPGTFAYLIGDPATDASFAARARDVEDAAKAADAKRIYWFNPNLSGSAKVGARTEPALDIRNPGAITQIAPASRTKYGNAWLNVVGQYLGNGVTATINNEYSESATVTASVGTATVNDASATPLYDYSGGAAPATVLDSFFFVYDKDNTTAGGEPAKIVTWIDLTKQADSASTKAAVTTAIGAKTFTELGQFHFWKSEVNAKQHEQAPNAYQNAAIPNLSDADNAAGWRINQITYPELVDLLESGTDANTAILFGGTWCPNTRPVLPAINKYAQQNDVTVFNFDTVLDGGIAGGSTTGAVNPLQIRNTVAYTPQGGQTIPNSNPTSLYGDLVSQYLTNIKTEYDYTKPGGPSVTYFPGGDTSGTQLTTRKLQVPFVIGYRGAKGGQPNGGVTRQWIIDNGDGSYKEYMSQWWYTNPQPNAIGITPTQLPAAAPIWATLNQYIASFTWQTDPTKLYPSTTIDTDDADYLVATDKANVTYNAAAGTVSVSSSANGAVVISPAALATALEALGAAAPTNLAAARTAYVDARKADPQDPALIANLTTVVGAWGVAQTRKNTVISRLGTATSPGSVAGGLAAVHQLDVFFSGLPRGVVSRRTVTAATVKEGAAPRIDVAIANDYGRAPTGDLSLVVTQGGTPVASATTAVANDSASFTLPALAAGTYDYTLSYADDDQLLAFTDAGTLTVLPADPIQDPGPGPIQQGGPAPTPTPTATPTATKVKAVGKVTKAPTSKKAGKYRVTITGATVTGTVKIKLKKGSKTKTLSGKLSRGGVLTVKVPKLARGTWKVTISWSGGSATGTSIKVKK
jgi:hypothetical protein